MSSSSLGYSKRRYKIQGMTATIQHNGRLANPMDPIVKALKQITKKRDKTDEDFEAMGNLEWEGSLYLNEKGKVVYPAQNLQAMLIAAAKKRKLGKKFNESLMVFDSSELKFSGEQNLTKRKLDNECRLVVRARVGTSSVMRTRPIFKDWSLEFEVNFMADEVDETDIDQAVETAGRLICLSDWRPRYGHFNVVAINGKKA